MAKDKMMFDPKGQANLAKPHLNSNDGKQILQNPSSAQDHHRQLKSKTYRQPEMKKKNYLLRMSNQINALFSSFAIKSKEKG